MNAPKLILLFLIGVLGAVPELLADNAVTNSGFENGTSGWTTYGSVITATSEQKHSGNSSCLNTARSFYWQGCVQDLTGKLTVGVTYRVSAWVRLKNAVAETVQMLMVTKDILGDHYFGSEDPLVSNDAWTPLVFYYTNSVIGITNTTLSVYAGPSSAQFFVEFFVDDVVVESVYAPQAVEVDLSVNQGAVTQCGSGFLFGLSATDPATNYYEPLKPKLQRDRAALNGNAVWGADTGFGSSAFMNRVQQAGAKHQVIISDDYCWDRNYQNSWGWPGDAAHNGYGPYDLLDQTIDDLMASARTNNYQVEWDIWNEPDYPTFWGRDQAQFFATWKHAYQRVRSNDPNAVIVGPSIGGYDRFTQGQYLTNFLLYARTNNVLPDIVSFHELGTRKSVNAEVQAVRAFMASNGILARPIDLNEYVGNLEYANPGIHTWYLAGLERAGVRRAAHAIWDEVDGDFSSNPIFAGRLAHLLTRDTHQPRAVWHVYKAYADLVGNLVKVSPGIQIDGLAALDTNGTVRMVLGSDSLETNSVNLTINRLNQLPYYSPTGVVQVIVQRIPNTGLAALSAPLAVTNMFVTLTTNKLILPLTFGPAEVMLVSIQQPPAPILKAQAVGGGQVRLAWPTNNPGFQLLHRGSLSSGWMTNSATVNIEATNFVVYESLIGTQKFYRLIK
ncbi:MAG: carbohydrate binding domain-containing protein [Verrucomicrobiota bacterium]